MTLSPAEIGLSPDATARLEDYLGQVRAALAGAADVNPDEIEADIREHVENELRGAPRPISLAALDAVLTRLGPPSQWGTTNDPSLLHRAKHLLRGAKTSVADRARSVWGALWRGPEDWRLAYLSFGIFAIGALTAFVFPLTLLISYFLSRAGIALAQEKGIELGAARKWLLYPPVVIVSLALLIALAAWPVGLGAGTFEVLHSAERRVRDFDRPDRNPITAQERQAWRDRQAWKERMALQVEEDRKLLALVPVAPQWAPTAAAWFVGAGAVALWWMLLGTAAASYPGATRAVFFPLFNRFERHHGMWLAVLCLLVLIPWGVVAYEVVAGLM